MFFHLQERECHELQEDRAKKDKELECAFSEILAKNVEIESLKKEILWVEISSSCCFKGYHIIENHVS